MKALYTPLIRILYVITGLLGYDDCDRFSTVDSKAQNIKSRTHELWSCTGGERLNIAMIAGLPLWQLPFWANRLIPSHLADRAAWEIPQFISLWR